MTTLPAAEAFEVHFGVVSTVTPVGGAAVSVSVIWEKESANPSDMAMGASSGSALTLRDVAWVRKDRVSSLPVGSTIVGGETVVKTWRVVSVDDDPTYYKAVVI